MIHNDLIPLMVGVPLAGAFLNALLGRKLKGVPDLLGILCTMGTLFLGFVMLRLVNAHHVLLFEVGNWPPPIGIAMVVDGLTVFMLLTVNLIAFLVVLYSTNYMSRYTQKWQFYSLFMLMLAGMNGVIVTGDIFNLFVYLEIAAVASYALVAFGTERQELEAAFKYAVMGSLGSMFVLLGVVWMYAHTSTLNMADMAMVLRDGGSGEIVLLASVLFLVGFGLKAALVPFHAWLPDAHPSAPAPISAMLSGVLIKALGVYAICRLFYSVFGITWELSTILLTLGTVSMCVGVLLALKQWDMKRLLAYSSISQVGYIMIGIGIGTPLGILAALFHLFNHSVFKSLLFLGSGAVEYATGTRDLRKMGGLARRMPLTAGTSMAGSMSLAGIPPFAGFWSKLLIVVAAVQAGLYGYAIIAIVASILTLAYVMKMMRYGFLGNLPERLKGIKDVPAMMKLSMSLLALICIAGGLLLLPQVRELFLTDASKTFKAGTELAFRIMSEVR
ncbi:NADH/ubiquinone/plastoquinone (complex I) [Candidatus Fermentibacteria bacterium]|nr:NADH/ubiquinone/plastoquinone (complex I) [Candidatus Fermentibacteria bacterium]